MLNMGIAPATDTTLGSDLLAVVARINRLANQRVRLPLPFAQARLLSTIDADFWRQKKNKRPVTPEPLLRGPRARHAAPRAPAGSCLDRAPPFRLASALVGSRVPSGSRDRSLRTSRARWAGPEVDGRGPLFRPACCAGAATSRRCSAINWGACRPVTSSSSTASIVQEPVLLPERPPHRAGSG